MKEELVKKMAGRLKRYIANKQDSGQDFFIDVEVLVYLILGDEV